MAEKNNGFMKAFLPGLVIGLVVGGIAGAVLPELLAAKPIHTEPVNGASPAGARERDEGDPGIQPGDLIVPETPVDDEVSPEEDGDGSGG